MNVALESAGVSIPVLFIAGLASFLSPCVLPLVPGYLAYTGATSIEMIRTGSVKARGLVVPASVFVAGFTVVFVALGVSASAIGGFLVTNQNVLTRVSGVLIIFMGLAFMGVVPLPWLYYERRLEARPRQTIPGAFAIGLAFGFGWTPCIGPALGVALGMAASERTAGDGPSSCSSTRLVLRFHSFWPGSAPRDSLARSNGFGKGRRSS